MNLIFIFVAALAVLGFIAFASSKIQGHGSNDDEPIVNGNTGDCSSCDGNDAKCEQICQMEAAVRDIEYYDDEELDRYKGRPSDQYTDEEAEEFFHVMETMHPDEVKGWNRSLILREINMPDQIKDEYIALANDGEAGADA